MKAIRDLYTDSQLLKPVAVTATITGTALDLANAIENAVLVHPGLWTDGTHTVSLTDSADNTTFAACAAGDLVGSFAAISSTATAIVQKVSYIGSKRYVKPVITVATATTGLVLGIAAITKPHVQPAA